MSPWSQYDHSGRSLDATGQNVEFHHHIDIVNIIWPLSSASRVHFKGSFSTKKGIRIKKLTEILKLTKKQKNKKKKKKRKMSNLS